MAKKSVTKRGKAPGTGHRALGADARARGAVLPGEHAAKVCTKAERGALTDVLVKAAYRVDGQAVANTTLGAGSVVSVGIHIGEGGLITVKASVRDDTGREYEVNA